MIQHVTLRDILFQIGNRTSFNFVQGRLDTLLVWEDEIFRHHLLNCQYLDITVVEPHFRLSFELRGFKPSTLCQRHGLQLVRQVKSYLVLDFSSCAEAREHPHRKLLSHSLPV